MVRRRDGSPCYHTVFKAIMPLMTIEFSVMQFHIGMDLDRYVRRRFTGQSDDENWRYNELSFHSSLPIIHC
jgi:hypothetical protein